MQNRAQLSIASTGARTRKLKEASDPDDLIVLEWKIVEI
jgi:hypothetical protein